MNSDSRVVVNTLSQTAGRALVVFVSLITTAVLTRTLGTDGFGNYVFLTSIVLLFVGLSDLGATIIGVREASSKPELKPEIFSNILSLRFIYSFILFIVFNVLVLFLPQFAQLRKEAFVASFVFPFLVLRTTSQAVLQSSLRLDLASFLEAIASILFLSCLSFFLLLKGSASLWVLMLFWVASALLSGIYGFVSSDKFLKLKFQFDRKLIERIFRLSFPLGIYLLVYAVYDRGIDSFFLKTFVGSQAVGLYGLAYKVHGNLILGGAFLMNSLFPIISSLKPDDEKLTSLYQKTFSILLLAGLIIFVLGFFISPLAIKILSGDLFYPSANILRILLFATVFSFLNHLCGYLMISQNQQKPLLYFSLFSLFLNLILNFIFIPRYSFWAAAVVTVITEGTIFFLCKNYLKKKFQLQFSLFDFKENIFLILKEKQKYFENLS